MPSITANIAVKFQPKRKATEDDKLPKKLVKATDTKDAGTQPIPLKSGMNKPNDVQNVTTLTSLVGYDEEDDDSSE